MLLLFCSTAHCILVYYARQQIANPSKSRGKKTLEGGTRKKKKKLMWPTVQPAGLSNHGLIAIFIGFYLVVATCTVVVEANKIEKADLRTYVVSL